MYKLIKNRCRLNSLKFSFSFRVINVWNFLRNDIVCCSSVYFAYKTKRFDFSSFIREWLSKRLVYSCVEFESEQIDLS